MSMYSDSAMRGKGGIFTGEIDFGEQFPEMHEEELRLMGGEYGRAAKEAFIPIEEIGEFPEDESLVCCECDDSCDNMPTQQLSQVASGEQSFEKVVILRTAGGSAVCL